MTYLFQLVPQVRYGPGAAGLAGESLRALGVRHALVVSDPGVLDAGICDRVLASIKDSGISHTMFTDGRTNPTGEQVSAAAAAFTDAGCDGMVGVGGGSAMDVAKCAATV